MHVVDFLHYSCRCQPMPPSRPWQSSPPTACTMLPTFVSSPSRCCWLKRRMTSAQRWHTGNGDDNAWTYGAAIRWHQHKGGVAPRTHDSKPQRQHASGCAAVWRWIWFVIGQCTDSTPNISMLISSLFYLNVIFFSLTILVCIFFLRPYLNAKYVKASSYNLNFFQQLIIHI